MAIQRRFHFIPEYLKHNPRKHRLFIQFQWFLEILPHLMEALIIYIHSIESLYSKIIQLNNSFIHNVVKSTLKFNSFY